MSREGVGTEANRAEARVGVVVVEDEALFRDLLRIVLSHHPRLEVVGTFADGESVLATAAALRPRVAILDIELAGALHGIQVGLLLRRQLPEVGIVLLSNHADPQYLASLPRQVVAGWSYLLKRSVSDAGMLMRAIEGAAAGLVVIDPALATGWPARSDTRLARCQPRQREILELVAQGFTNAAIAERLGLAEKSVENQLGVVYQHLDVDREDAAVHPRVSAVLTLLDQRRLGTVIPLRPAPASGG